MATLPISARIAVIAQRQHGLVTNAQLVDIGFSVRRIHTWTTSSRLERVLPGVLRLTGVPTNREQGLHAAVLWGGSEALVSHRAAGELWGFDGISAARPEITTPERTLIDLSAVLRTTQLEIAFEGRASGAARDHRIRWTRARASRHAGTRRE